MNVYVHKIAAGVLRTIKMLELAACSRLQVVAVYQMSAHTLKRVMRHAEKHLRECLLKVASV